MNSINYVTSYSNPDTDGVACSIAMAKLLSSENEVWMPVVFGLISDETAFVLKRLRIAEPKTITSLADAEKIVLVDTHHKSQLSLDFPFDKVVIIVDHHPNGDGALFPNATIINDMVGAAASLVARMFFDKGIDDAPILALLGFAILSNTLCFSAPSTTDFDRKIYNQITTLVPIPVESIDGMFEQRSLILQKDMYSALCTDFKVFDTKAGKVGISQIEAYNLLELMDTAKSVSALKQIATQKALDLCLFNGVDIKTKRSVVLAANDASKDLLCSIFKLEHCNEPQIFDRILLRKTDFIPPLNV